MPAPGRKPPQGVAAKKAGASVETWLDLSLLSHLHSIIELDMVMNRPPHGWRIYAGCACAAGLWLTGWIRNQMEYIVDRKTRVSTVPAKVPPISV